MVGGVVELALGCVIVLTLFPASLQSQTFSMCSSLSRDPMLPEPPEPQNGTQDVAEPPQLYWGRPEPTPPEGGPVGSADADPARVPGGLGA